MLKLEVTKEVEVSHSRREFTCFLSNKKLGDNYVENNSEDEDDNEDGAPQINFRTELIQGAAVRLGSSIPNQDQPSP